MSEDADPCGMPLATLLEHHKEQLSEVRRLIENRDPTLLQAIHTDHWLVRFLLHSSVEKAAERIFEMLLWRRENELDAIAEKVKEMGGDFTKFPHYNVVNGNIPMELIFGYTTEGCPFAVERWGQAEPIRLLTDVRPDQYLEFCLYKFEFMRLKLEELAQSTGKFLKWCAVMDVAGANMTQCNKTFVDMLRKSAKTTELHYRELIGKVYVVNANRIFTFLWGIVKNFLPARTFNKITISKDPMKALVGNIPESSIPGFLGGAGPDRCPLHLRSCNPPVRALSSADSMIKSIEKNFNVLKGVLPRLSIAMDGQGSSERGRSPSLSGAASSSQQPEDKPSSPREQRLRHLASFKPLLNALSSDSQKRSNSTPVTRNSSDPLLTFESDSDKDLVVSPPCLHFGWLQKRNGVRRKWTRRFFRLYLGELAYYRKEKNSRPIRVLSLYGYSARDGHDLKLGPNTFCLFDNKSSSTPVVVLQAPSSEKMLEWLAAVNANCQYISSAARQYLSAVVVDECSDSDHESVLDDSEVIDLKKARRASTYRLTTPVNKLTDSQSASQDNSGVDSESHGHQHHLPRQHLFTNNTSNGSINSDNTTSNSNSESNIVFDNGAISSSTSGADAAQPGLLTTPTTTNTITSTNTNTQPSTPVNNTSASTTNTTTTNTTTTTTTPLSFSFQVPVPRSRVRLTFFSHSPKRSHVTPSPSEDHFGTSQCGVSNVGASSGVGGDVWAQLWVDREHQYGFHNTLNLTARLCS